eukprot:s730_g3.t1
MQGSQFEYERAQSDASDEGGASLETVFGFEAATLARLARGNSKALNFVFIDDDEDDEEDPSIPDGCADGLEEIFSFDLAKVAEALRRGASEHELTSVIEEALVSELPERLAAAKEGAPMSACSTATPRTGDISGLMTPPSLLSTDLEGLRTPPPAEGRVSPCIGCPPGGVSAADLTRRLESQRQPRSRTCTPRERVVNTALDPDSTLKLALELQVTVCDYVAVDVGDVDRLSFFGGANDTAVLEALLRHPQDPNLTDSYGHTALTAAPSGQWRAAEFGAMAVFAAAQHRHLDVVHLLIQKGADMEKADYNGRTPLCIASQNGYLDVVRLLIEKGADIDKAENDGWTPVYARKGGATPVWMACQMGHLDVVRLLIEEGADKGHVDDDTGATCVFIATHNGHIDEVRLLIEKGADQHRATHSGVTPLAVASAKGHLEMARVLDGGDPALPIIRSYCRPSGRSPSAIGGALHRSWPRKSASRTARKPWETKMHSEDAPPRSFAKVRRSVASRQRQHRTGLIHAAEVLEAAGVGVTGSASSEQVALQLESVRRALDRAKRRHRQSLIVAVHHVHGSIHEEDQQRQDAPRESQGSTATAAPTDQESETAEETLPEEQGSFFQERVNEIVAAAYAAFGSLNCFGRQKSARIPAATTPPFLRHPQRRGVRPFGSQRRRENVCHQMLRRRAVYYCRDSPLGSEKLVF